MRQSIVTLLVLFILGALVSAHDLVPGAAQGAPILLSGGTLHTVANGTLEATDLLLVDGRIAAIGKDLVAEDGTEIINVTGKQIYPALIAAGTNIGLIEIGAVRATRDNQEVGRINPDVQTHIAYDPDSEIIPTVRSNGIGYAQIVPGGGLIRGRSCLLSLDAWTKEDAAVNLELGLHISWPAVAVSTGWWEKRTPEDQKKEMGERRDEIRDAFADARAYALARQSKTGTPVDSRWEAMRSVLAGDLPVFIHANDFRQIEQAVHFSLEQNIRMILVGGLEAWKVTGLLVQHDIPVIYGSAHSLPMRHDDDYDLSFRVPHLLYEAGVKFCFGQFGSWGARNLPFDAGQAVAFGLDEETAVAAMTLRVAEILGAAEEIGSLEVGKRASVIISDGNIMDHLTHHVTHMFIDGRSVDLDNRHRQLYRKYRQKSL